MTRRINPSGEQHHSWPRTNYRDLTGQRFGRLTVVEDSGERAANGCTLWLCRCDCGAESLVITSNLTSGNTVSCGCYFREVASRIGGGKRRAD